MWLQDKKKGVSIMVGYVLLVVCAVIMGVIVYRWIITYVPTDPLDCPDGVSIFAKEVNFNCEDFQLDLTLKNNGLFNTAGYFIHATNDSNQTLATIDLSNYTKLGEDKGGTILFGTSAENSFEPNEEKTNIFDLTDVGKIYSIEIIPVRFQEEDGKMRFTSCGGSKIKEMITCWVACVADESCKNITCMESTCTDECDNIYEGTLEPDDCGARKCGPAPNGCGDSDECGTCTGVGEVCNIIEGTCSVCSPDCSSCDYDTCDDETCVEDTCNSSCGGTKAPDCEGLDGIEGTADDLVCGPAPNGCGDENVCGPCNGNCIEGVCFLCNFNEECEIGIGEDCSCLDCDLTQGDCEVGFRCEDFICQGIPLDFGCADYCMWLYYSSGVCRQNPAQCTVNGEVSVGEEYCDPGLTSNCCCKP